MRRRGHFSFYEQSLEAYLIQNNIPFVATNETKRATYNNGKIKNFDLMIPGRVMLMIDLKGRRFGYSSTPKNLYENWIHQSDADGLSTWAALSSENQKAYLVFAYCLPDDGQPPPEQFKGNLFYHNNRIFSFHAITIQDYLKHSKRRSNKPPTISVSRKILASMLKPFHEVLAENKI